jgi:hypothetical protein
MESGAGNAGLYTCQPTDSNARRITIGEGAFFKGGIDIRKADQGKNKAVVVGNSGDQTQAAATLVQAQQSALKAS